VEFLPMPDGSLLVSDDISGNIYRLTYVTDGLPATTLTLRAPAAPSADVAGQQVVGFLTGPDGDRRDFGLAWGKRLVLNGLPHGDYKVEWKPFDDWVPETREMHATLSTDANDVEIAATYIERPDVNVELTLTAPAKPDGALAETWQVMLRRGEQAWVPVDVPWGGETKVPLEVGDYTVHYPYTERAYPAPMRERFQVDYDSPPFTRTAAYTPVEDLGKQVLLDDPDGCVGCHSASSWDDPVKAMRWVDNVEAL